MRRKVAARVNLKVVQGDTIDHQHTFDLNKSVFSSGSSEESSSGSEDSSDEEERRPSASAGSSRRGLEEERRRGPGGRERYVLKIHAIYKYQRHTL